MVGFDLHNEPHGQASWGTGNLSTDWRLAAERCGNAIQAVHPEVLIIVEGVQTAGGKNYWWGGNLKEAGNHPVRLDVAGRLVYSTHDYPASVHHQPWFNDPRYPANLESLWEEMWGYLVTTKKAPVLIGEFGTFNDQRRDQQWFQSLARYIDRKGLSFTYWCWNPNSGDTGGILQDDWNSVQQWKMNALQPFLAPMIGNGD